MSIEKHETSIIDTGRCGSHLKWTLDSEGTLNISGHGKILSFDKLGDYKENIVTVHINEGITILGDYSFSEMHFKEITIPESVKDIGEGAFAMCRYLKSVKLPYGIEKIKEQTFSECFSLKSVDIPGSVTIIEGAAFEKCESLKEITIPDSVISIEDEAFCGSALRTISLPDNIKNIGTYAFSLCRYLKSAKLPDGIKKIPNGLFSNCSSLREIDLPNNIEYVYENAFYGTPWLEEQYKKDSVVKFNGVVYAYKDGHIYDAKEYDPKQKALVNTVTNFLKKIDSLDETYSTFISAQIYDGLLELAVRADEYSDEELRAAWKKADEIMFLAKKILFKVEMSYYVFENPVFAEAELNIKSNEIKNLITGIDSIKTDREFKMLKNTFLLLKKDVDNAKEAVL